MIVILRFGKWLACFSWRYLKNLRYPSGSSVFHINWLNWHVKLFPQIRAQRAWHIISNLLSSFTNIAGGFGVAGCSSVSCGSSGISGFMNRIDNGLGGGERS